MERILVTCTSFEIRLEIFCIIFRCVSVLTLFFFDIFILSYFRIDELLFMTGSRTIYQRVESRSIADWKRELASVQSQGNLLEESKICNSIAKLYESGGRLTNALKYHMADEDICQLLQDVNGLAVARGNIGGIYLK